MRNKYFTLIMTFALVLCIFCTSVTVMATGTTEPSGEPTQAPTQATTESTTEDKNPGGLVEDEEDETTTRRTTTTEPVIVTETEEDEDNTTTTKEKPSSTTTTRRNNSSSNTNTTRRNNDKTTKAESTETTDETLPEGQFYVHLVLGNGEKNKKTVMKKAGLVTAPKEPVWEGHIFEGWYSDAKFTKPWDFSKDKATEEITIYAKWSVDAASILYTVTVSKVDGGKITVSPASATAGTPVLITVKPDSGKRLVEGSLTINGKRTDVLSFDMPAENVVISAKFENVPETVDKAEEKDNSIIYILVGAGILVVGLVVAGIVMLRRKNEIIVPEFDENGAVIIDDDDEVWVDESLVIEDAFPDAKPTVQSDEYDDEFIAITPAPSESDYVEYEDAIPVEKTKGLTDIANNDAWSEADNDEKLVDAVKEEQEKPKVDISGIDFSMFE